MGQKESSGRTLDFEIGFGSVADSTRDAIVLASPEGKIISWNKGAEEMFGYSRKEAIGNPLTLIIPERYKEKHQQGFDRFKTTGKGMFLGKTIELQGIRKDGSEFPVELTIGSWMAEGQFYFSGIIRDISERKALDAVLRESEERYRALFEKGPFPKWVYDLETLRFLEVNEAAVSHYGYTREEFLSMRITDIRPPEDLPNLMESVKSADRDLHEAGLWRHLKKDGAIIYVEITSHRIRLEGREARLVVAHDVTGKKKAEAEIRRYVDIVDNMQGGIYVYHLEDMKDDKSLRMIIANKTSCNLTGIPAEEAIGHYFDEIFPAGRSSGVPQLFAQVVRLQYPAKVDEILYSDERISPTVYSFTAFPLPDQCVGVIFEDISDRKKAEEKERALYREIAAANQQLNDFAQVVSHDLKAPLRGINSLATWLMHDYADKLDDAGKEQLRLMSDRVKRMNGLIDGILQYSRAGRTREEIEEVDLNRLVEEVIVDFAEAKHVRIWIENPLPVLSCERTKMKQIFQNLISNAVKYMDKASGQVRVGCADVEGFWKYYVADNGPGIEERFHDKIFQIFQTLSPKDASDSSGIGLSVVKKIVEMSGGKIWVESTVGSGSTFYFLLPKGG